MLFVPPPLLLLLTSCLILLDCVVLAVLIVPQGTDVPFAHTLAQYPVHRQRPLPTTFAEQKDQPPPPSHIPTFLPAFPDPHTYQHTPAYTGHQTDPHKQRQVSSWFEACLTFVGWMVSGQVEQGGLAAVEGVLQLHALCISTSTCRRTPGTKETHTGSGRCDL